MLISIESVKKIIANSIETLDFKVIDIGNGIHPKEKLNLYANNQCFISNMPSKTNYILTHEHINTINEILQLTTPLKEKLNRVCTFHCKMYGKMPKFKQPSNKIAIDLKKNSIELSLAGTSIRFLFVNDTINIKSDHFGIVGDFVYTDFTSLHSIIDGALDKIIINTLNSSGFKGMTETSDDVVAFSNKSVFDLLQEQSNNSPIYYLNPTMFVESMKLEFPQFIDEFFVKNPDFLTDHDDDFCQFLFDDNYIAFVNSFSKLIKTNEEHCKFKQLINLMLFYNTLFDRKLDLKLTFHNVNKSSFFKGANDKHYFYTFYLSDLEIYVGHNICNVETTINKKNKSSKLYSFQFDISKPTSSQSSVIHADNIDGIYKTVLGKIRQYINKKIDNEKKTISQQHIDIFKMLTI